MSIEDDLRGATVSMNRWRNGIKDDGPSSAVRASHLHRCCEAAAGEIDRLRDILEYINANAPDLVDEALDKFPAMDADS